MSKEIKTRNKMVLQMVVLPSKAELKDLEEFIKNNLKIKITIREYDKKNKIFTFCYNDIEYIIRSASIENTMAYLMGLNDNAEENKR